MVASFYKRADLFSMLTGPPGASCSEIVCECVYLNSQSVACNAHAAEALRSYWQEELAATNSFLKKHPVFDTPGPHSVARLLHGLGAICVQDPDCNPDFVVPLRLYGDGADAYRYLAYIIRPHKHAWHTS